MPILIELTEAEFQSQVTELARRHGWAWLHVHTTGKGQHAPLRGPLGVGWPDLILIKGERLIAAELKAQKAPSPTMAQRTVLGMLLRAGAETYVWRPSDLPLITFLLSEDES